MSNFCWEYFLTIADEVGTIDKGEYVRIHHSYLEEIADRFNMAIPFLINESRETKEEYESDFLVYYKNDVLRWKH